jgi:hypothetical protein
LRALEAGPEWKILYASHGVDVLRKAASAP